VKEFVEFCVNGPGADAGSLWASSYPGKYLEGGKAGGGQIVDQRLLPRIVEGEVRLQMVKDTLFQIVHKKPRGGGGEMSAVSTLAEYSYYPPNEPMFAGLKAAFEEEVEHVFNALGIAGEPLPILWTADFIPVREQPAASESLCPMFEDVVYLLCSSSKWRHKLTEKYFVLVIILLMFTPD